MESLLFSLLLPPSSKHIIRHSYIIHKSRSNVTIFSKGTPALILRWLTLFQQKRGQSLCLLMTPMQRVMGEMRLHSVAQSLQMLKVTLTSM